jgi:uncharacterized protein
MAYSYESIKEPPATNEKRIMIIGMPGIGNVGKISADYIIDVLKMQKMGVFKTNRMPVFSYIDSNNVMRLPEIGLYQKKMGESRIFILSGDFQPLSEEDMFSFCECLLNMAKKWKIKEMACTGGVGLNVMPDDPKIYVSSASGVPKKIISLGAIPNVHGIIGTIAGVTGLLPVIAPSYKIKSYSLLVETVALPDSISLKSASNLIVFLTKAYGLRINLKRLDDEMKDTARISELDKVPRGVAKDETSYIG